jgi:hypothetical protein
MENQVKSAKSVTQVTYKPHLSLYNDSRGREEDRERGKEVQKVTSENARLTRNPREQRSVSIANRNPELFEMDLAPGLKGVMVARHYLAGRVKVGAKNL